jgi:hypothetical protein
MPCEFALAILDDWPFSGAIDVAEQMVTADQPKSTVREFWQTRRINMRQSPATNFGPKPDANAPLTQV